MANMNLLLSKIDGRVEAISDGPIGFDRNKFEEVTVDEEQKNNILKSEHSYYKNGKIENIQRKNNKIQIEEIKKRLQKPNADIKTELLNLLETIK